MSKPSKETAPETQPELEIELPPEIYYYDEAQNNAAQENAEAQALFAIANELAWFRVFVTELVAEIKGYAVATFLKQGKP